MILWVANSTSIKASALIKFLIKAMMDKVQGFFMGWFCVWANRMCLALEGATNRPI